MTLPTTQTTPRPTQDTRLLNILNGLLSYRMNDDVRLQQPPSVIVRHAMILFQLS